MADHLPRDTGELRGCTVDIVDSATRSRMMRGIKGKNTRPEMAVRRYLHAAGLRFRVHDDKLPGRPDLSFPSRRLAVFVHGCFWHRHEACRLASIPGTRAEFWTSKFESNIARDKRNLADLQSRGWKCLTIWECEVESEMALDRLFWAIAATPIAG